MVRKTIYLILISFLVLPLFAFGQVGLKGLKLGERSSEVKDLQEILSQDPTIYPEKLTTGYFGQSTKKAIERLQKKFGLPQTGILDEKTASVIFPCTDVKITVLVPNGGENWDRKDFQEIKWELSKADGSAFSPSEIKKKFFWPRGRIDLIKADGTFVKHISSVNLAQKSYKWKISNDIPNGSDYKIRIGYWWIKPCPPGAFCPMSQIVPPLCLNLFDESDGAFTISGEIPPASEKIEEAIGIVRNLIEQLNKLLEILQSLR